MKWWTHEAVDKASQRLGFADGQAFHDYILMMNSRLDQIEIDIKRQLKENEDAIAAMTAARMKG